MESQEYWELGAFLIVIGAGAYFVGQYINSNIWRILEYAPLGDQLLTAGPIVAVVGVIIIVSGIIGSFEEKKISIESSLEPTSYIETDQIKYCGQCGTPNPIDNIYCKRCGKKLG